MAEDMKGLAEAVLKTAVGDATEEAVKLCVSASVSAAVASVAGSVAGTAAGQVAVVLFRAVAGTMSSTDAKLTAPFSEPLRTGVAETLICLDVRRSEIDASEEFRRLDYADNRLATALSLSRTGVANLNIETLVHLLRAFVAQRRGATGFAQAHLIQANDALLILEKLLDDAGTKLRSDIRN